MFGLSHTASLKSEYLQLYKYTVMRQCDRHFGTVFKSTPQVPSEKRMFMRVAKRGSREDKKPWTLLLVHTYTHIEKKTKKHRPKRREFDYMTQTTEFTLYK